MDPVSVSPSYLEMKFKIIYQNYFGLEPLKL